MGIASSKFLAPPLKDLVLGMLATEASYTMITKCLLDSYGSQSHPRSYSDFIEEFQSCKYRPEEGVQGLVCRLRALAERAYKGQSNEIIEDLVKRQCLNVLPEPIKSPLVFQNLANPSLALKDIIRVATSLEKSKVNEVCIDKMSLQNRKDKEKSGIASTSSSKIQEPRLSRGDKTCSYCKAPGHVIEQCRKRNRSCFSCGQVGHFIGQCPERADDQASKSSNQDSQGNKSSQVERSFRRCPFCGQSGHVMAKCKEFLEFMENMMKRMSASN